jgi:nicotinamide mononucleotide transporter
LYKWLIGNYVELLGVITSLVYLYFSVRQIIWLWPFGILSSALFIWIFFTSKFYADMGLQVYYLGVSIYGWYYWSSGKISGKAGGRPVIRLKEKLGILLAAATLTLWLVIVWVLKTWTDSDVPWGDGFTTAASIIATWMLARKILEHWLVWIVVDMVAASLYIYKGLYPTAFLYMVYSVIAVTGFFQWKKSIDRQSYV